MNRRTVARNGMIVSAIALLASLLVTGCAQSPAGPDAGREVFVQANGYPVDLDRIEEAWRVACECNGYSGKLAPTVAIRTPAICSAGNQCFECTASNTGWCAGVAIPAYMTVQVTPDLSALDHELSHLACYAARAEAQDWGRNCENRAGECGL